MVDILSRYEDTGSGYIKLYLSDGRVVEEHRFLMEKYLGRVLETDEVVHHKDSDKKNNSLENLEVMFRAEHARKHASKKNAKMVILTCSCCGELFSRRNNQVVAKIAAGQKDFYCCRSHAAKSFGRGRSKNR